MNIVKEAIHEITEHPIDFISSDMELDNDLAIDSIKKIMLMQKIIEGIGEEMKNKIMDTYGIDNLVNLKTVGQLEEIIEGGDKAKKEEVKEENQSVVKEILAEILKCQPSEILLDKSISEMGIDDKAKIDFVNKLLLKCNPDHINNKKYDIEKIMHMTTVAEFEKMLEDIDQGNEIYISEVEQTQDDTEELPMNYSQHLFFMSYFATGTLSLASRIRIEGEFDEEGIENVWNDLLKGQPSLRSFFTCDKEAKSLDEVSISFEENYKQKVEVFDIRDYSYLNQDKCIHEFCQRILNSLFDIYVYPLCRLYAFRLSDNVTEIVLASCHLVSDGLGNQQILRDFVSLYRAYLKKNSLDYGVSFLAYKQAVEESLNWIPDGDIKPQPAKHFQFPLEKENKNEEPFGNINSQIFHISKGDMTVLSKIATKEGLSTYSIIVSSYLLALKSIHKEFDEITINLPTGGRTGKAFEFNDVIGCFAQNMTITFKVTDEDSKNPIAFAKSVKDTIDEHFVNQYDMRESYSFVKKMRGQNVLENKKLNDLISKMAVKSLASNLYLSFVGDTHIDKEDEAVNVLDYKAYTGMNKNSIDALIEMDEGRLMFSLNYDIDAFSHEFIRNLYDKFKFYLSKIRTIETVNQTSENAIEVVLEHSKSDREVIESLKNDIQKILDKEINVSEPLEEVYGISSIEKMKLLTELISKYQVNSKVHLFQAKTVEEMAKYISLKREETLLAPAQKWLTNYFEKPYRWFGYSRFSFKAKLDTKILEEALEKMFKETEALRMRLYIEGDTIKYELQDHVDYDIKYYSDTANDKGATDKFIEELLTEEAKEFSIDKLPLLKVRVLVHGDYDYEFLVIGHHIVLDMVSNDILYRRLWNNYWTLLSQGTIYEGTYNYENEKTGFDTYIRIVNEKFNLNRETYMKYWQAETASNTRLKTIDRQASNNEKDAHMVHYTWSLSETKQLQKMAASMNSPMYGVLSAVLYNTVKEITGNDVVTLSHRMHGRVLDNNMYMDTVGNFAINYPIAIDTTNKGFESLVSTFNNKLRKVPMNGASYDLCGRELGDSHYPDNKVTDIRINYLGNRDVSNLNYIELNSENDGQRFSTADQVRTSEIEVFFYLENGCMNIGIEYSKERCKEKDIRQLMDLYVFYAGHLSEDVKEIV